MPRPRKTIGEDVDIARPLRSLLLSETTPNGTPLFATASQLGRVVAELGIIDSNEATTIGYVSLVLRGERGCSEKLREALGVAVDQRLSDQTIQVKQEWLAKLSGAIDALHQARDGRIIRSSGLANEFKIASEQAKSRFIITPVLAERRHTPEGRQLMQAFIARLGLTGSRGLPNARYTMCHAEEKDATALWRAILREIVELDNPAGPTLEKVSDATKKIREIDAADRLRVFILPYYLCLTPVALYDIEDEAKRIGFILLGERNNYRSLRMPDPLLERWQQLYIDFENDRFDHVRRISFADNERLLVRELGVAARPAPSE